MSLCCYCHKELGEKFVWAPTKNPNYKIRIHSRCVTDYLDRLEQRTAWGKQRQLRLGR